MDKKFVEDYKKIKPTDALKARIMCEIAIADTKSEKVPFYKMMKPLLSGALACVLLIACFTVIPLDMLGNGEVSVSYTQSGETIAPTAMENRAYTISAFDSGYEYDRLPSGLYGAELTFDFEGKTEIKTDFGSVYKKNADGSYEQIDLKSRIEGNVTIFWAMPENGADGESVMTLKNRDGEWILALERYVDTYKANLIKAE